MRIPSKHECFQLMCQMEMMDHIAAHSIRVCRVALFLADGMIDRRLSVDRQLVATSSLLHDITKTRSFTTGENHAQTGDRYLESRGFPELGRIVGQHVRLNDYGASGTPTAAEIVNYADKRVLHDKIATLDERMDYIVERYGQDPEMARKLRWIGEKTRDLETKIFACVPHSPDTLSHHVDQEKYLADLAAYRRVNGKGQRA